MSIRAAIPSNFSVITPDSRESHALVVQQNPNPELYLHRRSTKRKRNLDSNNDGLGEPFQVQAHPSSPFDTPLCLTPKLLISRSCLPLACLEPWSRLQDAPAPQFFSAYIVALEASSQRVDQPTVLITEPITGSHLYAIERVKKGVYAICKLGAWVTLQNLELASMKDPSLSSLSQNRASPPQAPSGSDWWRIAAIQQDTKGPSSLAEKQKISSARGLQLCLKAPSSKPTSQPSSPVAPLTESVQHATIPDVGPDQELSNLPQMLTPQSPADLLSSIRVQYQEALYVSKASLAYFAKGPLSRARVIFNNKSGSPQSSFSLIQHLRSMVLPLPLMDKKYRETLTGIIKDVPMGNFSDDENGTAAAPLQKKTRKSKKDLIGKNALYPDEGVQISRWWSRENMPDFGDFGQEAREELRKVRILEQKARETQLQMILMLEILALEALSDPGLPAEPSIKAIVAIQEDAENSKRKVSKAKKPQDLPSLLEMSIDRLSIWLSISEEDMKASDENLKQPIQQGRRFEKKQTRNDLLREFCTDVILPFYAARVPQLCATICRKLGGPRITSPRRPPSAKAASNSQAVVKPGAVMQRPSIRKPRRTLERVLTDDKRAFQRPLPSLMRSATDSVLPRLKREGSNAPLTAIPLNRASIEKSKRYSQREVDLKAVSQATEAKLKKKMSTELELKGAIAALRKPNPRMAVRDLIESAERRLAGTESQSRKVKNPTRNPFAQGIQVMATPKGNRQKDVFGIDASRLSQPLLGVIVPVEPDLIPPSSGLRVPSTSSKTRAQSGVDPGILRTAKPVLPTVQQTPTRRPSKLARSVSQTTRRAGEGIAFPPLSLKPDEKDEAVKDLHQGSSPELPHYLSISCATTSNTSLTTIDQPCQSAIQESPPKSAETTKAFAQPTCSLPENHQQGRSIYESLGWDDDIDELM